MSDQRQLPQRIVHYKFGKPEEVLRVEESPHMPALGPIDMRVRVSRSMIHPGDLQLIASEYSSTPAPIPDGRVPGFEAAGIIEDAAPSALAGTGLAVGMRVVFFAPGAWQGSVVVPAQSLVALPDDISDDVATQLLINTVTARHVLRIAQRSLGAEPSRIVLTGAASAVGKIIATKVLSEKQSLIRLVRSEQSAARLGKTLPGGAIISTGLPEWRDTVRKASDGDIPVVIDGVGGPMVAGMSELLNPGAP